MAAGAVPDWLVDGPCRVSGLRQSSVNIQERLPVPKLNMITKFGT